MAVRYAVATGLWSSTATWNGGTLPAPGDQVHANGFTVTIDQDIEVEWISTAPNAPALAGGGFVLASVPPEGRVLACGIRAGSSVGLTIQYMVGATITGLLDVTASVTSSSGAHGIVIQGDSVLTIEMASVTGTYSNCCGLYSLSSGSSLTVNVSGNVVAGGNSGTNGITCIGVLNLTAHSIFGGTNSSAGVSMPNGTVNAVDIFGGLGPSGTGVTCGGALSLTAVRAIAGNALAISAPGALAVIDILGECRASNANYAINTGTPNIRVRGPLYHAPNNRVPVYAPFLMVQADEETIWEVRDESGGIAGGAPVVLSNYVANSPAPENVRAGVAYGPDGTLTGTAVLPDPSAVAAGVPVDDEVGTAALRLTDVAAITGQQIASTTGA